jgi:hypothetical protein
MSTLSDSPELQAGLAYLMFGDVSTMQYSQAYLVPDFKCNISRRHNDSRPDGTPRCESVDITVIAQGNEDLNLYQWYTEGTYMTGWLVVVLPPIGPSQPAEQKLIVFENALCYAISEEYHINQRFRRILRLSIVAEEITIDSVLFKANQTCQN